MQEFYIKQHSVNPVLRMELICDGRYDYKKSDLFNKSIQNADVTFSMRNTDTNILKVSKAKAEIVTANEFQCGIKHILQYSWKERDVKEKGIFEGWFEIVFHDDMYEEGVDFPVGKLIVPIEDKLIINII
jgi:uncharacterized protein YbbK (DUF523 family)